MNDFIALIRNDPAISESIQIYADTVTDTSADFESS